MYVLLIDDHPLVNSGLASCLEETGRFSVSGQVNSLAEAMHFIEKARRLPSLIILDILLGEENGLDFLPFLKSFCRGKKIPKPPVLVCSVLEDPFRIQTALKMGASGYVSKSGSNNDLLDAIDMVLRGEIYITGDHNTKLNEASGVYTQFTKRELEVLHLIKQNKTNQEIAKAMAISIRTVENHISNIYFKTGTENRLDLLKM
ncbi:MAG: response regulator transcription factor [Treponema sp.]|jgi:NarL family two-component system response regulator LiaR|nr:response regulator transcription factor [Treponema sp.]